MASRRRAIARIGSGPLVAIVLACLAIMLWRLPVPPAPEPPKSVAPATPWLTLPTEKTLTRIAFGSCLHQARPQHIWKGVLATRPELFLMAGDNIYGDSNDVGLAVMRQAYALQAANPELARLRAVVPVLATWDDHDFGRNDAGADYPFKAGARELFADFWQIPKGALPTEGVYRSALFGNAGRRVQVILLDLRWFRGPLTRRPLVRVLANRSLGHYQPSTATRQDMLGPAQWAWLEAELRKPAEVRIIVSSIQLLAENHGWERWGNLPKEKKRFFDLLERTNARGVVIVSGDRHRAAIYSKADKRPYAIPEISSSSLNMAFPGKDPPDPNRLGDMYEGENFGTIQIDWQQRRLRASIWSDDAREVAAHDVTFADIGL